VRPRRFDLVIKVGGSLGRRPRRLAPLMRQVAALARDRRLLVLPGGGLFADRVRRETGRLGLADAGAHRLALRAMDRYGRVLARCCPGALPVRTLSAAARVAAGGRAPILLASAMLSRERRLERSFRLTSDSIAAYLAARTGASGLALVKSAPPPVGRLATRDDALRLARRGLVDPLFPSLMPRGIAVWIIDGRRKGSLGRVAAATVRGPVQDQAADRRGAGRSVSSAAPRAGRRGTG
jgi:aspartokinase-like uncharacterized kinase